MPSQNFQIGKQGETLAASYLMGLGYTILDVNWRHHHWELDIIAAIGKTLHFVEVKTRTSLQYGHTEQHISGKKMTYLKTAVCNNQYLYSKYKNIKFKVVSINIKLRKETIFYFIECF